MDYIQQSFSVSFSYRVFFTRHLFAASNPCLADFLLSQAGTDVHKKLLVVLDAGMAAHHPGLQEDIRAYLGRLPGFDLAPEIIMVPGGEAVKNDEALFYRIVDAVDRHAIDRHSFILAMGGGSLLDMAGYAAAVSHRGIRHIRIPTTVLSQNDSGVGVKNGINYKGKKNFLGTFAPPAAVFNDTELLTTLDIRDWRAGISEAVKVALIRDAAFFEWLETNAAALAVRDMPAMETLVRRCADLHMQHISGGGDPFESGSSRPLDFGHWSAHKLEQLTGFALRHGEAVAIGIALDVVYSHLCGWLDKSDAARVLQVLQTTGLDIWHPLLLPADGQPSPVLAGLEEFREHLGGRLTISLLRKIGKGEDVHQMDANLLQQAARLCKSFADNGQL